MALKLIVSIIAFSTAMLPANQYVFGVDGKPILCVPGSDIDSLLVPYADISIHLRPGGGHVPNFPFLFSARTMKSIIPGYVVKPELNGIRYVNPLSGTIGFLGPKDKTRLGPAMRARDTEDEWYARGQCPEPTVTAVTGTTFYKVKCSANANYASIWDRAPVPQDTMPRSNDLVVATCNYEDITAGPYKGARLKNCTRVVVMDDFLVDYKIQEENVGFIPRIDAMIRHKLLLWRENCSIPA